MIPMGKIKRGLNTNERLENALKMFKDIESCIQDILAEPEGIKGKAMTTICQEHGIDYLNLRKILSLSSFQNIYTDKVITADEIELPEMDPWEKLFRAVFGINKSEPIELPVDIKESIQYVMNQCLTDREQKILNARFGLIEEFDGDPTPMTLEDVGEKMSVTRDRIRQIEAKAIRKLRHPEKSKLLRDGMIKTKELEAIKEMTLKRAKEESEKRLKEYEVEVENKNYNIDGVDIPDLIIALKQRNIAELDLTVRTFNALLRHNIRTIYDLVVIEDYEFRRRIRNLGKVSQKEVIEKLNQYLCKFNTTRDELRELLGVDDESDKIINHYHGDWTE